MRNLPNYRDPLWILGVVFLVVSWFLPWGSGWLVTPPGQHAPENGHLIWFFETSRFTVVALLIGFLVSIFGLYYLPVEFALGDTPFQWITALVSGFLVTSSSLQWMLSPSASSTLWVSLLVPVFPFEGKILYGAYLAVVAGALIMVAGIDPLIRTGHNYIVRKRR